MLSTVEYIVTLQDEGVSLMCRGREAEAQGIFLRCLGSLKTSCEEILSTFDHQDLANLVEVFRAYPSENHDVSLWTQRWEKEGSFVFKRPLSVLRILQHHKGIYELGRLLSFTTIFNLALVLHRSADMIGKNENGDDFHTKAMTLYEMVIRGVDSQTQGSSCLASSALWRELYIATLNNLLELRVQYGNEDSTTGDRKLLESLLHMQMQMNPPMVLMPRPDFEQIMLNAFFLSKCKMASTNAPAA